MQTLRQRKTARAAQRLQAQQQVAINELRKASVLTRRVTQGIWSELDNHFSRLEFHSDAIFDLYEEVVGENA